LGEYLKHVIKLVEADEFMLAMKLINTGETAQPPGIAFGVDADHDNFLAIMRSSLFAEGLVLFKDHCKRFITRMVNIMSEVFREGTGRVMISLGWLI
jgi:predicted Rossmann-fold nucleotide-binding protein